MATVYHSMEGTIPVHPAAGVAGGDGTRPWYHRLAPPRPRYSTSQLRAWSQLTIRTCCTIVLFLGLRFPVLCLTVLVITGRLYATLAVALMWFTESIIAGCMLWFTRRFEAVRAALALAMGCTSFTVGIPTLLFITSARDVLFLEPDGTVNASWHSVFAMSTLFCMLGVLAMITTTISMVAGIVFICAHRLACSAVDAQPAATLAAGSLDLPTSPPSQLVSQHCPWWQRSKAVRAYLVRVSVWLPLMVSVALILGGLIDLMTIQTSNCSPSGSCYSNCDPLDTTACMMPFPSSYYLQEDAASTTGFRVAFPKEAMPVMRVKRHTSPTYWNEADGFSTIAPLLFYLQGGTMLGIPNTYINMSSFASSAARTVIVEADTGERHAHFVELNVHSGNGSDPVFILQPASPLKHSTRYVVGVSGIVGSKWNVLPQTPGFAQLLASDSPRARRFATEVLPVLAPFAAASNLQLAWDFVTVSANNSIGRVEVLRDTALASLPAGGPQSVRISKVEREVCGANGSQVSPRVVWGYFNAPFFLTSKFRGAFLPRPGGVARPTAFAPTDTMDVGFVVMVPCSLLTAASEPATSVVQYGHGLLGTRGEATEKWLAVSAQVNRWVVAAVDWYGISMFDVLPLMRILLSDLSRFPSVPESTAQGFVNQALLVRLVFGSFGTSNHDMVNTHTGRSVIDAATTQLVFMGNSMGSVAGGGYVAMSTEPRLTRAAFGVPGSPFALLLYRSLDFDQYQSLLSLCLYSGIDVLLSISLFQQLWDMGESAGWLHFLNEQLRPGTQAKTVLLQVGYGDAQVTPLAAHVMARSYGASTVKQQMRPVFGVPELAAPLSSSAMVEWNYTFVTEVPRGDVPANQATDTHTCVRTQPEAMEQVAVFVGNGTVIQPCTDGPCVSSVCCFDHLNEASYPSCTFPLPQ